MTIFFPIHFVGNHCQIYQMNWCIYDWLFGHHYCNKTITIFNKTCNNLRFKMMICWRGEWIMFFFYSQNTLQIVFEWNHKLIKFIAIFKWKCSSIRLCCNATPIKTTHKKKRFCGGNEIRHISFHFYWCIHNILYNHVTFILFKHFVVFFFVLSMDNSKKFHNQQLFIIIIESVGVCDDVFIKKLT